jgi:hypothetical protein
LFGETFMKVSDDWELEAGALLELLEPPEVLELLELLELPQPATDTASTPIVAANAVRVVNMSSPLMIRKQYPDFAIITDQRAKVNSRRPNQGTVLAVPSLPARSCRQVTSSDPQRSSDPGSVERGAAEKQFG